MSAPSVSVLLSVYNGAGEIGRSLDSLFAQELADFELVVVDDGSVDESARRVEERREPRFRVIRQENEGLTTALNRGLSECRAPLVARLDCGDTCHPRRLLLQKQFMDQRRNVLACGCRVRRLDEHGRELGVSEVVCDPGELHQGLMRINLFQHSSLMMRREALDAIGGYREFFRYAQDLDLLLRLSEQGPLGNLPQILSDWALDPGSISFRRRPAQEAYAEIARRCARERREGKPDPVDAGVVDTPLDDPLPQAVQRYLYHLEAARSAMMGGRMERVRQELALAAAAGLPVSKSLPLQLASRLPGFLRQELRRLRVRRLVRKAP